MELNTFIAEWADDSAGVKAAFVEFKNLFESLADTKIHFNARPGITYSLRGEKTTQGDRPLFAMVDVIDDDPENRWLSVCFYGGSITDPDEMGDVVPGGLLGEDGHCFDLEDSEMQKYLADRIAEAHANQ